jgi:rubrerythrin
MPRSTFVAEQLTAVFLKGLLSRPEGRAHLLNSVADAEDTGEAAIFERLLRHVEDPRLRQMITRHQADEIRHAELLRGCLRRTGVDPGPVPAHLRLLDRLDRLAGGLMAMPVEDDRDVMIAYLMLLVIEERALHQFAQFVPAFERVDPVTAAVFREIARDEERHLRYCHAISRRYAPGEATWEAHLHHFRTLEARAYAENNRANMDHLFERGIHRAGPLARRAWGAVQALAARSAHGPRTPYWGTTTLAAA